MKILVCSDGSPEAAGAVEFASRIRSPGGDAYTLLGIRTRSGAELEHLDVLREQQLALQAAGPPVDLLTGPGEPVGQIEAVAEKGGFDLMVLGGRRRGRRRMTTFGSSTYRVVRALLPPVLVVTGSRGAIRRILVAVGVGGHIQRAVDIAGTIAAGVGARVTLLHVFPEAPVAYGPLHERAVGTETIPAGADYMSRLVRGTRDRLAGRGVGAEIRLRYGLVADEILREAREGDYDTLVIGTSPAGGEIRRYLRGDLTRDLVDGTPCPILVVRTGASLWRRVYVDFKGTLGLKK